MNPSLPAPLTARIATLLEGVSRHELVAKASAISAAYRAGGASAPTINDESSVIAYVLSRMPATYAATVAVFEAVQEASPEFAPKSLFDAGCGPGTASWAATQSWRGIAEVTMADSNPAFLTVAKSLAADLPARVTCLAAHLGASTSPRADLVTAAYVLAEIEDAELIVRQLWTATREVLVLIEPGTPAGFRRIRAARQQLIASGAHVLAPCTHDAACPITGSDWCHFSQRLPRSRDHLKVKNASVPFEDERYSYVALTRRSVERSNRARIIAPPKETKAGVAMPLCTERGLHQAFVSRRQRDVFATLRKAKWGDTILSEE
ncbi:MAG TPA: small ribosomal subunit Rsm22 family protein [Rhizomicrobium sp.]|jgi:ribosomal protein RSM22 (predicted rRNA methylase)